MSSPPKTHLTWHFSWDTNGEWTINQPLPVVKLRLLAEDNSIFALDHKELATHILLPYCGMSSGAEWYKMKTPKGWNGDAIELRVAVKFEKPQNIKKCGFLYAKGKKKWKKVKKRFFMLFQVSQYNFTLCSYRQLKAHPTDKMSLQGYTVDYANAVQDEEFQGARFFFRAATEGDEVLFASTEDVDRHYWVDKLYNATGQSFKPAAPKIDVTAVSGSDNLSRAKDADRARKHGLDDVIQADPIEFEHFKLFELLQKLTLSHRLNDSYTCLGWFSPGQLFVLDEYCARYGVRGCHRHLCYLSDLLERAENGVMIDATLLHYTYAFCASHVLGNKPDGVNTVTVDEKENFAEIKERLKDFLSRQITQFRYCFPFGRPEGALKNTLTLYEKVLPKDVATPGDQTSGAEVPHKEKLEKVIQLAELCIELIQQNEEHHSEALTEYSDLMVEHTEIFWSLYVVDMDDALSYQPVDTWDSFALFQMLNNYLRMEPSLCSGKFHQHLRDKFAPLVIRYIDLMESSIAKSLDKSFATETWTEVVDGCAASEAVFWKLGSIQSFIRDLHWPDEVFANHLDLRLKLMASDMIEAVTKRVLDAAEEYIHKEKVDYKYIVEKEICVMLNSESICADENAVLEEYRYHSNVLDVLDAAENKIATEISNKLATIMENVLKRLARLDQGKFTSIFASKMPSNDTVIEKFIEFILSNLGNLLLYVKGRRLMALVLKVIWDKHCQLWCDWLVERQEVALHKIQFDILSAIIECCRSQFENQGLNEQTLETEQFKAAYSKLQIEKALLNLNEPSMLSRDIGELESYRADATKLSRRPIIYASEKLSNEADMELAKKCPFLRKVPSTFLRKSGPSLIAYAEKCPVMSQVLCAKVAAAEKSSEQTYGVKTAGVTTNMVLKNDVGTDGSSADKTPHEECPYVTAYSGKRKTEVKIEHDSHHTKPNFEQNKGKCPFQSGKIVLKSLENIEQTFNESNCEQKSSLDGSNLHKMANKKDESKQTAFHSHFDYGSFFNSLILKKKADHSYRIFKNVNRLAQQFPYAADFSLPHKPKKVSVWCSNDYLGMSRHPTVAEAAKAVITNHGVGAGGTRNISGTSSYHTELEKSLADWHGKEAGLLFTSCYVANDTTLHTLGNQLPGCVIFSDRGNHASMIHGIRTSSAKKVVYNHNDPSHLEELLKCADPRAPKIVAFETVHSMSGSVCPVKELCDVAHKYGALTFIDEVHAVGLYGERGAGIGERDAALDKMDIISGTLGKAVGVIGGYITGRADLIDIIRSYGSGFIFTTALPPDKAAAALASIDILKSDEGKNLRLRHQYTVGRVRNQLLQRGIPVEYSPSHIIPVPIQDADLCSMISSTLQERFNIYIQAINYPTVPRGREKLRIAPTPWHTEEMIQYLIESLDAIWNEAGLPKMHPICSADCSCQTGCKVNLTSVGQIAIPVVV
eukprot:gene6225-6941_t